MRNLNKQKQSKSIEILRLKLLTIALGFTKEIDKNSGKKSVRFAQQFWVKKLKMIVFKANSLDYSVDAIEDVEANLVAQADNIN